MKQANDKSKPEKNELKIKNFRLSYKSLKDRPVVIDLNRLAIETEREPADVYRLALQKGILVVAAQHGVDIAKFCPPTTEAQPTDLG